MFWWFFLGILLAASSEIEAEIQRLREVMEKRYRKELWEAVDNAYENMIEIDKKADFLTADDHMKGAMAANSLGDMQETLARLKRSDSEQASAWSLTIRETTGQVDLVFDKKFTLVSMDQFPAFEVRKCLEFANQQLKDTGEFHGRLPNGAYQYGLLQLLVSKDGTIPMKSESLDAPSRKELKKEKEKSKDNLKKNLKKKLNRNDKPNKNKVSDEEIRPKPQGERTVKDGVGVESLIATFVVPIDSSPETVSFLNIGAQIDWERAWSSGVWQFGVNPQISFGGLGDNRFAGFSPVLFLGASKKNAFLRAGLVPQLMFIDIPTTEVLIQDGAMLQVIEGGTTFGWGGELLLGMNVRDDLAVNLRTKFSSDLSMYYVISSLGVKYYYQ